MAQQELALAQAQLAQRTIRSPLSGVVVEKYLSEGERVEEKPVVKVATIDPLRVEVIVPASYFSRIKQGMSATVKPDVRRSRGAQREGHRGGQGDRCGEQQLPRAPRAAQSEQCAAPGVALQGRLRGHPHHWRSRSRGRRSAPPRPRIPRPSRRPSSLRPRRMPRTNRCPEEPAQKPAVKASVAAAPSK